LTPEAIRKPAPVGIKIKPAIMEIPPAGESILSTKSGFVLQIIIGTAIAAVPRPISV